MTSITAEFAHISSYYDGLIRRFGHDPRACDYGRAESQSTKFRVLSDVCDMAGKRVLDVGCGFADYARFLAANGDRVSYVGMDITPAMIAEARKIDPALDLRCGNLLEAPADEKFDVVTANGIFYLLKDAPFKRMCELVTAMYERCVECVAFNSLSSWARDQQAGEFYADPLAVADYCRSLTPWMTLRHDYHSRDFTVYLYRDRRQ